MRRHFDDTYFGVMTDGRRLLAGQTTDTQRMCGGFGGSTARLRRQCDGRTVDGRPKCVRHASGETRGGRATVAHPSSVPRAAAVHMSSVRTQAYFGLMTDGRRLRGGRVVVASLSCRRRIAVLSSFTRRRGIVHPSLWPCSIVVSCQRQCRQLFCLVTNTYLQNVDNLYRLYPNHV